MKHVIIILARFRSFYLLALVPFVTLQTVAQNTFDNSSQPQRRLNFMVSPKQKKFDQAPFSFQLQAKLMRKYHKADFYVIIVSSSKEMVKKITHILERKNALIGNIWFDSHGHYQRRRSLFEIGEEEFNYKTIRDSALTVHLKKLSAYCDTNTNVGIGSCYGGATYTLPAVETFPAQRMNGDSLMIGTSKLFSNATVYACESFVMTGVGIMNANYALAGMPGRKKFKDPIYAPVWEKLGEWNCYSGKNGEFKKPVTVSLHHDGRISYKQRNYLSFSKNKKKLEKKIQKFKRGNYNLANLYQAM
ncbi:hypothetical protein [Ferruginibacter sp.]|nr:hypothetical protein [Ferruginibacter sp.]